MLAAMASRIAWAPGRVNLIGEHVDYAHGRALPLATSLGTSATFTNASGPLRVRSTLDGAQGTLGEPGPAWMAVVEAAAMATGTTEGRLDVDGDLPTGAGLSSSTSFSVAVVLALGGPLDHDRLIAEAWRCEQGLGTPTGLLDQQAIVAARPGMAVLADFADGSRRDVPLPSGLHLAVVHSGVERQLASSPYAQRRAQVEAAERLVGPLGRATLEQLSGIEDELVRRRARHVVAECARVDAAVEHLAAGELVEVGKLIDESHASLRDDFEVSLPEIDQLADELRGLPGSLGVRLMGGGFGGCLLAIGDRPLVVDPRLASWQVRPGAGAEVRGA